MKLDFCSRGKNRCWWLSCPTFHPTHSCIALHELMPQHWAPGTLTLNKLTVNQADVFPVSHIPHDEVGSHCACVAMKMSQ